MSVIAIASLLATQAPVTLMFQPKVGTSYRVSMSMSQTSPMGNSSTSMTTTSKVLAFENGFYKLQSTNSNVNVTGGAGATEQVKKAMEKSTTMYMDKHFKPKFDKAGAGADQMLSGMNSAFSSITFPSKPVKVGDTWNNSIDMGSMMGAMTKGQKAAAGMKATGVITVTFKLLKIDGSSVTIGSSMNGSVNMDMSGMKGAAGSQATKMVMKLSGGGTSSMERSTGIPIGSSMKITTQVNAGGQSFSSTQTIATKRV